jgi:phosphatidylserine decarboxylase
MNIRSVLLGPLLWPPLNFIVTNCLPRKTLTVLIGRISKSERPWLRTLSMRLWRSFADVDLSEAETTDYPSMHACFVRRLKPGARPLDPDFERLVSPSDGIVGQCGPIDGTTLLQAKGKRYTLEELVGDPTLASRYANGCYATLRLTAGMYHRFHAPADRVIERVRYFAGDVWNVNPPTLDRVRKLFCRNERAVLEARLVDSGHSIALVPVAAILVASIRLHFLDVTLHLNYRGPHVIDSSARFAKGDEVGWFEHGSTIIVLAPSGYTICNGIAIGKEIKMGQMLIGRAVG